MKNMTTKAAIEYIKTLHQRSNDARYMSICEKVNEAKRALIKERDELESMSCAMRSRKMKQRDSQKR